MLERRREPSRLRRSPSAAAVATGLVAAVVCLGGLLAAPADAAPGGARVEKGIWISLEELRRLPKRGTGWTRLKRVADDSLGKAEIANRDSQHDVRTLAAALVYARTGKSRYRHKAARGIAAAIGTEAGGNVLALARNVFAYVVAADLIALRDYDRRADDELRRWLKRVRAAKLDGRTLVSVHEERPNNWGTHAGASRVAIAAYLGNRKELRRAARVFRGWLGDRSAYAGFEYGKLSWQADPENPVGVNPPGAVAEGNSIDGALPEEMRRGGSLRFPPKRTGYTWEALQGALAQAHVLYRQGFDAWSWQERALLRAARFLHDLDVRYGRWWATDDDAWQPWLVNHAYGTRFPVSRSLSLGKAVDFTDWTHARRGPLPPPGRRP